MDHEVSRRGFTKQAAGALAGGILSSDQTVAQSAGNRVNLALIGGRSEGRAVALRMIEQGARIKTFCDIDQAVLDKVNPDFEKAQSARPATVKDFRRVLDDKNIDAVVIATPDHWHTHIALLACQAGKDVYVEKPLCQTISEGQMIREAARKYNRVMQVGTQRRSGIHFQSAADYAASGKLGKVCLVKAWMVQTRKSIGTPGDSAPPSTVDYDVWLGPAPKRPFNENRFHYNWRFFWDYGNTELGNQGIHLLDVALSGIQKMKGKEKVLPKSIAGHGGIYWLNDAKEVPDTQVTTYDFGDLLLTWELRSFGTPHLIDGVAAGTGFYGTEGSLIVDGSGWKVYTKEGAPPVMEVKASGGSHEGNFLDCVKSRKRPNSDVEIGRLSTMLCHLGNISHRVGRGVQFDPDTETFGTDREANAYLTKQYRASYPLPKV
jgi:predicted dehydrogenase